MKMTFVVIHFLLAQLVPDFTLAAAHDKIKLGREWATMMLVTGFANEICWDQFSDVENRSFHFLNPYWQILEKNKKIRESDLAHFLEKKSIKKSKIQKFCQFVF